MHLINSLLAAVVANPADDVTRLVYADYLEERGDLRSGFVRNLCWIPAGQATLGSPASEVVRARDEEEHEFTTPGFWLGKYLVTQEEWQRVMGNNPSYFSATGAGKERVRGLDTTRFPVETVSWNDCQEFLQKVNACGPGGLQFRLPHDDEWEYACRGGLGNWQAYYVGNELLPTQANCNYHLGRTSAVGSYEKSAPHPWGLCDMHGNLCQWCHNIYDSSPNRVIRGGSWSRAPRGCRAANRGWDVPSLRSTDLAFRVAADATT